MEVIKKYPVSISSFFLAAGILSSRFIIESVWQIAFVGMIVIILLITAALIYRCRLRIYSGYILFFALVYSAGALNFHYRDYTLTQMMTDKKIDPLEVYGTVTGPGLLDDGTFSFIIETDSLIIDSSAEKVSLNLFTKFKGQEGEIPEVYRRLSPGDYINASGRFFSAPGRRNPGGFDYRNYLQMQGATGVFYIYDSDDIEITASASFSPVSLIYALRRSAGMALDSLHNSMAAGLLKAVLTAERGGLDPELKENFINSGVVHILAVSGLHVGFIAVIFFFLFQRWNIYLRLALTAAGLLFFLFFTGSPPSVFRAVIMSVVILFAIGTGRSRNVWNALGISAFIILAVNPNDLFNPGFQLSFAAVASILYFAPHINRFTDEKLKVKNRFLRYLIIFILVSLAAQLGTAPLTVYYFGKISAAAVFANIFIVPMAALIVGNGILTLVVSLFSFSAASVFAGASEVIVFLMSQISDFISSLDFSFLYISGFDIYEILLSYAVLIFTIAILKKFSSLNAALIFVMMAASIFYIGTTLDEDLLQESKLTVMMIDVGQGDAYLVRFPDGETALIDAGFASASYDYGKYVVTPLLGRLGIDKIDYGFITHIDADHYGGFLTLLKNDKVERIYKPLYDSLDYEDFLLEQYLHEKQIPVHYFDEQIIEIGGTRMYVLTDSYDPIMREFSSNDRSGVLKIVYGETAFLFTGDASIDREKHLILNYGGFLKADVLKAGHHGSRFSTDIPLVSYVDPKKVLISSGRFNTYGHPSQYVLNRLSLVGPEIYRSDSAGCIILVSDGKTVEELIWRSAN